MKANKLRVVSAIFTVFLFAAALGFTFLRVNVFAQDKAPAGKELAVTGESLFKTNCAGCHSLEGTAAKGGPALKGLFKVDKMPASGRPPTDAHVKAQLKKPVGNMPPFGHLNDDQVNGLIAYLKSL